ncbi:unnamed protein product [Notodromas monacha]|uniref:DUF4789 domain-containing protein n=1 Tax=Notodromas monacha TaxID=399045 RepID=A0A7R9BYU3_9CRUS|nr:unnamed protein product [Notodromas monacha]CAG0923336.1 unnamed protein product [Notodromas monacha]
MIPALLVLWISWALDLVSAGIIPPPWVDLARNPCSKDSWQQLYWPMDGQCYRIFQRGPCRETFELVFNGKSGAAECRCPHHHVMWIGDGLCYRQFSRGPCSLDEYLAGVEGAVDETQRAECRKRKPCPEGWLFWPQDGQCYSNYSKGPCFKGDLIYQDPETGDVKCGCESKRMPKFYWPQSYACYEHFTTGPCNEGYLFIHNRTARQVQCACNANLTAHYHPHLGECHQLNVQGPCARGQWYVFSPERRRPECQCRPQHTPWASTSREGGVCHREYTRGPCGANEAVVHNTTTGSGTCVPVPCKPGQLFFPQLGQCFRIGSRGPCPAGKLVMYEMYHRSTHRGLCSCSKDLSHNFWPETGECFETDTRGPCGDLQEIELRYWCRSPIYKYCSKSKKINYPREVYVKRHEEFGFVGVFRIFSWLQEPCRVFSALLTAKSEQGRKSVPYVGRKRFPNSLPGWRAICLSRYGVSFYWSSL